MPVLLNWNHSELVTTSVNSSGQWRLDESALALTRDLWFILSGSDQMQQLCSSNTRTVSENFPIFFSFLQSSANLFYIGLARHWSLCVPSTGPKLLWKLWTTGGNKCECCRTKLGTRSSQLPDILPLPSRWFLELLLWVGFTSVRLWRIILPVSVSSILFCCFINFHSSWKSAKCFVKNV